MTGHLPIDNEKERSAPSDVSEEQYVAQLVGVERIFRVGNQEVRALRRN